MRLIDADEYDRELQIEQMKREEGSWGQRFFEANRIDLANRPTVPAVLIEPLCRYLEVYARTPTYNMRHTAEWWKEELNRQNWKKWMEEQHE